MDSRLRDKLDTFFASYPLHVFDVGELLVQANDPPLGIFYLEKGIVRQYDISQQGTEIVVNVFKTPAFFPMAWAITGIPNRYFFEALLPVKTRVAPPEDVVKFLQNNNDVMFNLLSRLYSGVEGMQRRMAHLMGGSARTRLIFELITECKRFGTRSEDGEYVLTIREDELGARAGLTRETVNRELMELKRQGFVNVEQKKLVVRNMQQLEEELGERL